MKTEHTTGNTFHVSQRKPRQCLVLLLLLMLLYFHCRLFGLFPSFAGKSFREQQCEKYDGYNITDVNGNTLEWVPMYSGLSPRDRCKLVCRAKRGNEFKVFETKVSALLWHPALGSPWRATPAKRAMHGFIHDTHKALDLLFRASTRCIKATYP